MLIKPTINNTVKVWIDNIINILLSVLGFIILKVNFLAIGLATKYAKIKTISPSNGNSFNAIRKV